MVIIRRTRHKVHCVRDQSSIERVVMMLTFERYVENTLEHNRAFDAPSLVAQDPTRKPRLKYWDNELCRRHPHLFDFAVTVTFPPYCLFVSR